jgi:cohesin complex subunit SA-1/2
LPKISNYLNRIFVHRYRDIYPEIRTSCISELGNWIIEHPKYYLSDEYLKYIGWSLSDKSAQVRETAIKSLIPIYQREDLVVQMDLFTQRFQGRILQMTRDTSINVTIASIQLSTLFAKYVFFLTILYFLILFNRFDILEEEDISNIYKLISDENCSIRHETANFVYTYLFEKNINLSVIKEKGKKGDNSNNLARAQLKGIVDFIIESTLIPDLPNYVIDALWIFSDKLPFTVIF